MPSRLEVLTEDTLTEDQAAELDRRLDYAPVTETLESIQAPTEPLRLTRQSARRLVIQRLNAEMRMGNIPRRERRRLLFWRGQQGRRAFPISDLARQLVAAVSGSPEPTPQA